MMSKHQIKYGMNSESTPHLRPYVSPKSRIVGLAIEDICQNESIIDGGNESGWDD